VDEDEPVMESSCNFVRGIGFRFNPKLGVLTKHAHVHGNIPLLRANVFVTRSILSRPFPDISKHLPMEAKNKCFRQNISMLAGEIF
jgi:hypothetical protein